MTNVLEKGITQGTSLQKMVRELKDITGNSYNNAFRLIRTESSYINGQVTLEGYKEAQEVLGLEYYVYDAFLDSRTSKICRELDKNYNNMDFIFPVYLQGVALLIRFQRFRRTK